MTPQQRQSSRNTAPRRGHVAPMHRGPQAHATPPTQGVPSYGPTFAPGYHHAPNAALLIDFDNVTMGIRSDLGNELRNLLGSDIIKGKVAVQRAYADWRRYPQYIVPLTESSIDMIFAPAYGSSKKNATDIRLAVDAMELVFTRPEIGTYILLSGDSDFSSLVLKLKEYGKYVIGVGIRESSSDLLVMNCDEYYSYNALAGLVKSNEEEPVARDPWELVTEAIQRMQRNGDVMRSDRLKQVMQEIDANFDEGNLGFSKFSKFTTEAAQKGLITITRLENGQLEVAPAAGMPTDGRPAERAPKAERPERADGESEDRGSRSRRSRRGRGRDRSGREERGGEEVAEGLEREAEQALPTIEGAAETAPPERDGRPEPQREDQMQRVVVEDGIGQSGERLTRDEAFGLVRRAVESLTRDENDAVRVGPLRERARELLGRDSESLSERMFTRILRDAHDGDVIDLRRRGDDFEIARAAAAPSVRDQLAQAEAALSPASTGAALSNAAAARRGMGPRGIPGRGRGLANRAAAAGPPPDLFSVGVIDEPSFTRAPAEPTPVQAIDTTVVDDLPADVGDDTGEAEQTSERKVGARGAKRGTAKRGGAKRSGAKKAASPRAAATDGGGATAEGRPRRPRPRKTTVKDSGE